MLGAGGGWGGQQGGVSFMLQEAMRNDLSNGATAALRMRTAPAAVYLYGMEALTLCPHLPNVVILGLYGASQHRGGLVKPRVGGAGWWTFVMNGLLMLLKPQVWGNTPRGTWTGILPLSAWP